MKFRFFCLSILFCSTVQAQNFIMKEKLADDYYNQFSYYKAIPMYEQLLPGSDNKYRIYEKLADAYSKTGDSKNAERCYEFLVNSSSSKPEYLLYYAESLARNGKYDKAGIWYKKYSEAEPSDNRGKEFAEAYANIRSLFRDSASYIISKVAFDSENSDFSPAYFGENIVFVSSRKKSSIIRSVYNRTNSAFLDLYIASPDSKSAKSFSPDINTKYHEGPAVFTKNLDTIIFTRNNFYKNQFRKSSDGVNRLKLFIAVWNSAEKRWTNTVPLPFNSEQYSVGHPAMSSDGKTLYFSSDMPGTLGGTDLWLSHLMTDQSGNKSWGEPVNLGATVNTRGNEMFPSIDQDGSLWFASDGIPGLGGLDIFFSRKGETGFQKPENPGFPVNTRFDDFGYITRNSGKEGYLSSDRNNKPGDDDIFFMKKISAVIPVLVYDFKTNKGISSASVSVISAANKRENLNCNTSGVGKLTYNPSVNYKFETMIAGYEDKVIELPGIKLAGTDTLRIPLVKKSAKFTLTGNVYSADNNSPLPNATAFLTNKNDMSVKEAKCDNKGTFTFELQPETDYSVRVQVVTPGSKCSSRGTECSTKGLKNDVNFNQSFPVFCVGDVIKVENIYYDLGKYNIRPDAALELDKLYDIMKNYPLMKIELRSHTDSRGTPASNMILSDQRAKAAAEYLFSKGIERSRITSKGFGDTMPLNRCIKGVKCSEDEFKVNRRTEFKILSIE
jgi:outer membrane protein OmpA-like peptidoglycan-associated protein